MCHFIYCLLFFASVLCWTSVWRHVDTIKPWLGCCWNLMAAAKREYNTVGWHTVICQRGEQPCRQQRHLTCMTRDNYEIMFHIYLSCFAYCSTDPRGCEESYYLRLGHVHRLQAPGSDSCLPVTSYNENLSHPSQWRHLSSDFQGPKNMNAKSMLSSRVKLNTALLMKTNWEC